MNSPAIKTQFIVLSLTHDLAARCFYPVKKYIDEALEFTEGELNSHDIQVALHLGKMILWVVKDMKSEATVGVAVGEIAVYPQMKGLRIVCLGGEDVAQWGDELNSTVRQYCLSNSLTFVEAIGRPGLARLLSHMKVRKVYTVFRQEIEA